MNRPVLEPLLFDCEGDTLVGVLHRPDAPRRIGMITVVAGGPQYRAGVGRGLVTMGNHLAGQGIPVLRFDYRGMGDSGGQFRGFQHIGKDLAAAVAALRAAVPEVEQVVLWGGCDAASGILIHACKLENIASIAIGNPWVSSRETQSIVVRKHYLQRLREKSFWLKLLKFEYRLTDYAREAVRAVAARLRPAAATTTSQRSPVEAPRPQSFIERMQSGLRAFEGPVLLLMSGKSLLSKEFDELVQRQSAWQEVVQARITRREELPDADQAFSSQSSRDEVNRILLDWVAGLESGKPGQA